MPHLRSVLAWTSLALCSGCISVSDEQRTATPPITHARAATLLVPRGPAQPALEVVFEDPGGAEVARARAALAPAHARLGECRPGSNGVVLLRLIKHGPRAEYV